MSSLRDDAASRLWWAVKRYAALALVIVAACAGLAYVAAPPAEGPVYRAAALVIAHQLETVRPEHLPRMAEAIFTGGTVAEEAVALEGLDIPPRELIPDHAELEPIAGTVLLRVVGYGGDPALAAQIANAVAEALTGELNKAGPGVAQFTIQERARAPIEPEPLTVIPPALIGLVAGAILAFGAIALTMVLRRPVLSGSESAEAAEAVLLGSLPLTGSLRKASDPTQVVGLTAVVKQLYPQRQGVCVFVSPRRGRTRRSEVAEVVARALARSGLVCFVPGAGRGAQQVADRLEAEDGVIVSGELAVGAALVDMPVIIDGPTTDQLDVPQFLPPDSKAVLVVPEGAALRSVETAARQFLPGELSGVVFTRRSRQRGKKAARSLSPEQAADRRRSTGVAPGGPAPPHSQA